MRIQRKIQGLFANQITDSHIITLIAITLIVSTACHSTVVHSASSDLSEQPAFDESTLPPVSQELVDPVTAAFIRKYHPEYNQRDHPEMPFRIAKEVGRISLEKRDIVVIDFTVITSRSLVDHGHSEYWVVGSDGETILRLGNYSLDENFDHVKIDRNEILTIEGNLPIRISDENDVAMLKAHSSDVVGLLTNYVWYSKEIVKTIFDYAMQKKGSDILYTPVDEIISRQLGTDLPYSMQELRKMQLLRDSGRQHYIDDKWLSYKIGTIYANDMLGRRYVGGNWLCTVPVALEIEDSSNQNKRTKFRLFINVVGGIVDEDRIQFVYLSNWRVISQ